MPRNVEDIIPSHKRSIRDVPIPEERRSRSRRASDKHPEEISIPIHKEKAVPESPESRETALPRMKGYMHREPRGSGWSRRNMWAGGVVLIFVVVFSVLSLMRSATLTYTPKSAPLNFKGESFASYKTGGDGVLLFSVVSISDTKGVAVPATGETQVSRKASGTVVVYNNTSSEPQKLIKNTRFEATDGHVYRIQNDISIPGKSGQTPGSLEVTVIADQPGEAYNISLTDFTVPGLKGDPRFKTIYARSKTTMSGGLVGAEKGISPEALVASKTGLEKALKEQLIAQAQAQVPADFILFPSLSQTSFEDMPQSSSTATTVTVNMRGNFRGILFKKSDLAEYIKNKKLSIAASQTIDIQEVNTLALNFDGAAPVDFLKATEIRFTINGSATAVWLTDESMLSKDLVGHNKSELATILKNYPGVATASVVIKPFWKSSFPTNPAEINIKKNALK